MAKATKAAKNEIATPEITEIKHNGVQVELFRDGRPNFIVFPGDPQMTIGGRNMKANTFDRARSALWAYVGFHLGKYDHPDTKDDPEIHVYRDVDLNALSERDEIGAVSAIYAGKYKDQIMFPTRKDELASLFRFGWAMLHYKPNKRTGTLFTVTPGPEVFGRKYDYVARAYAGEGLRVCVLPLNGLGQEAVAQLEMKDLDKARLRSLQKITMAQKKRGIRRASFKAVQTATKENNGEVPHAEVSSLLINVLETGKALELATEPASRYMLVNAYGDTQYFDYWDPTDVYSIERFTQHAARGWGISIES